MIQMMLGLVGERSPSSDLFELVCGDGKLVALPNKQQLVVTKTVIIIIISHPNELDIARRVRVNGMLARSIYNWTVKRKDDRDDNHRHQHQARRGAEGGIFVFVRCDVRAEDFDLLSTRLSS